MTSQTEIVNGILAKRRVDLAAEAQAPRVADVTDTRHRVHLAGDRMAIDVFKRATGWHGGEEANPFCVDVSAAKVSGLRYDYCGKHDISDPVFMAAVETGLAELRRVFPGISVIVSRTEREVTHDPETNTLRPLNFYELILQPVRM